MYSYMYVYIYIALDIHMGITCFAAPTQCFQVFYMCTFQRCCARFTEVVHVSQKVCTFHKPPNKVRVQLYTHWAHSNQQNHWGDQTRSPDIYIYTYIYTNIEIYIYIHQIVSMFGIVLGTSSDRPITVITQNVLRKRDQPGLAISMGNTETPCSRVVFAPVRGGTRWRSTRPKSKCQRRSPQRWWGMGVESSDWLKCFLASTLDFTGRNNHNNHQ